MTKAEREALEALARGWNDLTTTRNDEYWAGMVDAYSHCKKALLALLATLDKPATRYPWSDEA